MRVFSDDGSELDATFHVEKAGDDQIALILESRGGARGVGQRNRDYNEGLELLLGRLVEQRGAKLLDGLVDSTVARRLPREERRLQLDGDYPLDLATADSEALRRRLTNAQKSVARASNASGSGSRTKRIRLLFHVPELDVAGVDEVTAILAGVRSRGRSTISPNAAERVASPARVGRGQGFAVDTAAKLAVEAHAMDAATRHFQQAGYDVEDVARNASFDLRCTRGEEVLHVEVKGTTSGSRVALTPNEVVHARERYPDLALFILHDIGLRPADDGVEAHGGTEVIHQPWDIDAGTLSVERYSWEASASAAIRS